MEDHPVSYFSISSSSQQNSIRLRTNPLMGYFSNDYDDCFFTVKTRADDTAWWMVDLKEYVKLEKIVVIPSKSTIYFNHVTFRFGNSSNYANNPEIPYSSTPVGAFPLTVYVTHSNLGRFVSLESKIVEWLGFGTILIIRE